MNRKLNLQIWMMTMAVLLMVGCNKGDEYIQPLKSSFMLYIYLPDQPAETRASDSDIHVDKANESVIKTLQVWVFGYKDDLSNPVIIPVSDGGFDSEVGSMYMKLDNVSVTGGLKEVAFDVPDDFNDRYTHLQAFAFVNAGSLGYVLDENDSSNPKYLGGRTTLAALKELAIEGSVYGIHSDTKMPVVSDIDAKGIPMTGCLTEPKPIEKINNTALFTVENLDVKRIVSKVRFVFSRVKAISSEIKDVQVTEIKFNGYRQFGEQGNYTDVNKQFFPDKEYLFTDLHGNNGDWAFNTPDASQEIIFEKPVIVPEHSNPWVLRWDYEETRQEWEDNLNYAINTQHTAVECARAYLRESPYCITGVIKYKVKEDEDDDFDDIEESTARFTMAKTGDFLRNHSWTIYAYFSEGGIMFEVYDWDKQDVTIKPFK